MFDRVIRLIGEANFKKIRKARVMVVGLGGVGGFVVEMLARSGVGQIILVDYDRISLSNLNRQIVSNRNNIGFFKTDAMEERILSICSEIEVVKINQKLDVNHLDLLDFYMVDYVIDCCDTISVKCGLIKRCLERDIKIISCMGAGNKIYPEELEIVDIWNTSYDPIAKKIRKYLRDNYIRKRVMVVCSKERRSRFDGSIPSMMGVPAVAGIYLANYVLLDIINMVKE